MYCMKNVYLGLLNLGIYLYKCQKDDSNNFCFSIKEQSSLVSMTFYKRLIISPNSKINNRNLTDT